MPRFTTASATRSSSARSSVVNTSAPDVVENAWDSSSRTLSHFSARDALEKEVITVWKGSRNLLSSGIIWRGWRRVNKRWRDEREMRERRDLEDQIVSLPVALVPHVAHFTRLVSSPGAATASHPIQWKRLIACF